MRRAPARQALSALLLACGALCSGASPASADRAFVVNSGTDDVSVIDIATNHVLVAPIPVGESPYGIAMTPDGEKAYVTNREEDTVSVIDTTTNTVSPTTIAVGGEPWGVAAGETPSGLRAYVANFNDDTVSVIDAETDTTIGGPIGLPAGSLPTGIALTPDGTKVYVTHSGTESVSAIDTASNTVSVAEITVGAAPENVAITPDGGLALVTNFDDESLSLIDTATDAVVGIVSPGVGEHPEDVAVDPGGEFAFVTEFTDEGVAEVDIEEEEGEYATAVGLEPRGIAISPDGTAAYVANSGESRVSAIDIAPSVSTTVVRSAFGAGPVASGLGGSSGLIDVGDEPTDVATTAAPGPGESEAPEAEPEEETPEEEGSSEEAGGSPEGGSSAGGSAASSSAGSPASGGGSGSATPEGALPPPVLGKSVDVEPAKGVVKTKCKGQKRFTPLAAGARVPLGCLVDTRHGVVVLTAASGPGGGTQTARFWSGLFRVGQTGGRRPYTTLALTGPLGCGAKRRNSRRHNAHRGSRRGRAQASRRRHKKGHHGGRSLWGSGKGHFRTKGRYGSASVRGTIWLVADRCDRSTLFRVRRGVVRVHDDTRGRSLNLRAGHSYIARPGRRGR